MCVCVWGKVLCGVCHHCSILAQLVELILDLISLNESMSIFHPSPPTLQSLSLNFSVSAPPSLSLSPFIQIPFSPALTVYLCLHYVYNPFSGFVLQRSQGAKPAWQSLNRKSLSHRLNSMKGLSIVLANK